MRSVIGPDRPFGSPAARRVELWIIDLGLDAHWVENLKLVLDAHELAQLAALQSTTLQSRYAVAHGAVRHILGRYLGQDAADVAIERDGLGKPIVSGSPLVFSVSHSQGLAVCAVAPDGQLGVDIEALRLMPDAAALARGNFSATEIAALVDLPERAQSRAFLNVWTRKEAFVKATGEGLRRPLDSFDVTIDAEHARLVRAPKGLAPATWAMHAFEPRRGFAGALVIDREIAGVTRCDWQPGVTIWPADGQANQSVVM